ncbi:MAG: hypothetical protein JNK49_20045 [Planctomycetes bacterium]|nr:hypothetical protein [Planctomycetota bacterium]
MNSTTQSFALATAVLGLSLSATAQFTPGNLVVLRVGTGTGALSGVATATFLDEYTPSGTLVQSVAMPTAVNGANRACTNSGSATSEGLLTQSADGRYLMVAGYDAAPGTTGVASTASATVNRVIARIALDGTIDTSTAIPDALSGNNIRAAASEDGSIHWATGGNGGVVLAFHGGNSGTSLNTSLPTNLRGIGIYGGQLFISTGSGTARGIYAVGSGLPTTAGQTLGVLTGLSSSVGSPYDFFFADASTCYVADDRTSGSLGGIQKWTESGGTWTLQYTLSTGATFGARGLSGIVNGGVATLYATMTNNQLVTVTDTGPASAFTLLTPAAANTAFRGVRFVRQPFGLEVAGWASPTTVGDPTLSTSGGRPVVGNSNFEFTIGNLIPNGFGFLLIGIGGFAPATVVPGAPISVEIYVNPLATPLVLADPVGAASHPLPIPAANSLAGLPLPTQLLAFDPALNFPAPIGSSTGLKVTIGQAGQ